MTHMPGVPVKFDPPGEWQPCKATTCRSCKNSRTVFRAHDSSCGGWEDAEYKCLDCDHSWWVDGIDS